MSSSATDLVLRGGHVMTMDRTGTSASSLAISNGRIVAVGDRDEVDQRVAPGVRVIDLGGRTVVPGFIDVHTHVASNAGDARNVECRDFFDPAANSVEEILRRMERAAARLPSGEWVVAVGSPMQDARMAERRLPTKNELDAAASGRPAYLTAGPHLLLANSRALEECSVTESTPDPPGGVIERDEHGTPNGVLREVAQQLVKVRRPGAEQDLADRILVELERCARRGVTMIHDIVVSPAEVRAYHALERAGRLPVRVRLLLRVVQSQLDTWGLRNLGLLPGFGSDTLAIGGVKISVDGGSSAGQAAFYPADGSAGGDQVHSVLRMSQEETDEVVSGYHAEGMQVSVHAVGDLALDMALRSFEAALTTNPRPDHRHRIEHMGNYAMTPDRLRRAKAMGLVAVPNPSSFYYLSGRTLERYGPERLGRCYPFRWLADEGLPHAFASDGGGLWPIDPLRDIAVCVSRQTIDGDVVGADDAISLAEGLRRYTSDAAWAGFTETATGSIDVGKLADLTVLSDDLRDVTAVDAARTRVDATFLGGQLTHHSGALPLG